MDVSDNRRASVIAQYVLGLLQKLNSVVKLAAQTYDGASVMSSELNRVQASKNKGKGARSYAYAVLCARTEPGAFYIEQNAFPSAKPFIKH